jgi:hypothetical protein
MILSYLQSWWEMNTWLGFILCQSLTVLLSLKQPNLKVRDYFLAQAVATPLMFFGYRLGIPIIYYLIYTIGTVLILWSLVNLALDGSTIRGVWLAIFLGLFLSFLAIRGTDSFTPGKIITFGEGFLLSVLGLTVYHSGLRIMNQEIISIGLLNLSLACYDFGYIMHSNWGHANDWVPCYLGIVFFGWILLSRHIVPLRSYECGKLS